MTPVLLVALGTWMAFASVGWVFGAYAWWLDAPNNGPQYSGLAAGLALMLALAGRFRGTAIVFALLAGVYVLRWNSGVGVGTLVNDDDGLSLIMANVHTSNTDADALIELIQREQPDVIGLLEVDLRWLDDLAWLREEWPFYLEIPRADNFGLALYSRIELLSIDEVGLGSGAAPSVKLVTTDGVTVWLTHPLPPVSTGYARDRDDQLAEVAEMLKEPDTVVMGDLNVTPWSAHFPSFDARVAGGTWPSRFPAVFRVPIDHVLVGPGLQLSGLAVGPHIGSDHRPLLARVQGSGR